MKKEEAESVLNNILGYLQKVNAKNEEILGVYSSSSDKSLSLVIDLEKSSLDKTAVDIRTMVAAEYDAIKLYTELKDNIVNHEAKTVINNIIEEEIVHAGEFLALLVKLYPEEAELYKQGQIEIQGDN